MLLPITVLPDAVAAVQNATSEGGEHNLYWMLAMVVPALFTFLGGVWVTRIKLKPENRPGGIEAVYTAYEHVINQMQEFQDQQRVQNIKQSEQIDRLTLKVDSQTQIIAEQETQLRRMSDHLEQVERLMSDAGLHFPAAPNRKL